MPRLNRAPWLPALVLAGCGGDVPGEVVGAYDVTMKLVSSSCGRQVVPFPDGERYPVEVRRDGDRGYWRLARAAPVSGTFDDAGFRFTHRTSIELGTLDAGTLGCTLLRDEELVGVLEGLAALPDGGVEARTDGGALRGDHRIDFSPDPAGRCRDQRGPLREFERLPCEAHYRLSGVPRAPF